MTEEKIIENLKSVIKMPIGDCNVEAINAVIKVVKGYSINEKALNCIGDVAADMYVSVNTSDNKSYLIGYVQGVLDMKHSIEESEAI
jgi:hypothetical protein